MRFKPFNRLVDAITPTSLFLRRVAWVCTVAALVQLAFAIGSACHADDESALDATENPTTENPTTENPTTGNPTTGEPSEDEQATPTGCEVGAEVPTFYVRDVTSRRPNLATCLVCRYGARPVVVICARGLDEQVSALIASLDHAVDAHRAHGLRGFAMFLDARSSEMQPRLTTLARRRSLTIPLVLPVETAGPSTWELPEDSRTTVLFYVRKRVVARQQFAADELDDEAISGLMEIAENLLAPDRETQAGVELKVGSTEEAPADEKLGQRSDEANVATPGVDDSPATSAEVLPVAESTEAMD